MKKFINNILSHRISFLTILILTLMISGITTAQNVEFKRSNFKDDVEAYKEATETIDKGTVLFEEGSLAIFEVKDPGLAFKKALIQFEIAQKFNPENALNKMLIRMLTQRIIFCT